MQAYLDSQGAYHGSGATDVFRYVLYTPGYVWMCICECLCACLCVCVCACLCVCERVHRFISIRTALECVSRDFSYIVEITGDDDKVAWYLHFLTPDHQTLADCSISDLSMGALILT